MQEPTRTIGSFGIWAYARLFQAGIAGFFVVSQKHLDMFALLIAVMYLELCYLLDCLASGYADDRGLYFRRYLKKHFVPWAMISKVEWRPRTVRGVEVVLTGGPRWRRRLRFALNPQLGELARQLRFGETPDTIAWLQKQVQGTGPAHP